MDRNSKPANPWKTIKRNILYRNKYGFTLREDDVINPNGGRGKYMVLENNGYVGIVALTKSKEIILVRQWRYPVNKEVVEIVAGYIEPGISDITKEAKRELKEETGGTSGKWHYLGTIQEGTSYQDKKGRLFLALDVIFNSSPSLDQTESITIKIIPFKEALEMIYKNKIQDEKTIIGILMAKEFLQKRKEL